MVSLEHAIAAPFCTRQLADLGARVIKVERPGRGDFARDYDQRTERPGLALRLGEPLQGKPHARPEAAAGAGMRCRTLVAPRRRAGAEPRARRRRAHGARRTSSCKARHPRLVVCDISGYGNDGPYRDKKAYDLLIQSEAGFLSVTGTPDEPCKSGNSIADIAAGMYAYSGILAALLQRGRTGEGSHIDVSMLESLAEWMGFPLYYAYEGQTPPPRSGASHATIYPYGPFPAGDGKTVMLGLQNEREWKLFCDKVLLQPALATDARFDSNARRNEHRDALRALIGQVFGTLTSEQVLQRLDEAQIANAHVNDMAEVWAHPQLAARQRLTEVGSPVGPIAALLPPGVHSGFDYRMDPIPAVGEHTEAILRELGRDDAQIALLREQGAI